MRRDPGDDHFSDVVPPAFESPFPSADATASDKFGALLGEGSAGDLARRGAKAFTNALQLTLKAQAIYVGDLLTSDLENRQVYAHTAQGAITGIFAAVAYRNTNDPKVLITAAADVGFNIAMGVLSQIPVYGQIAAAVLSYGRKLGETFERWQQTKNPPPTLPWGEYSRDLDEDLVVKFLDGMGTGVDFTQLYMPPFELDPWQFAWRDPEGAAADASSNGLLFAPVRSPGKVAWSSSGFGCIPNTARVLGTTQAAFPLSDGPPGTSDSALRRRVEKSGEDPLIPWSMEVTQTGDYFPSLGQLGLALWQQALRPSPMMYRIDCAALRSAWEQCSANLFETGFASLEGAVAQLKASYGGIAAPYLQVLASQLLEPYVAVRRGWMPWDTGRRGRRMWELGAFPSSPRPSPIIHAGIFSEGPVPAGQRTDAAWFEENLARKSWGWPYADSKKPVDPKQDWQRLAAWDGFMSPDGGRLVGLDAKNPSKGFRATPWPFPELAASTYAPLTAITTPAIDALAKAQKATFYRLWDADIVAGGFDPRMLVCAYVRPDPVEDLPRYGAFATDEQLRDLCRDARDKLVELIKAGHPARTRVDLRDVDDIDPQFADRLWGAGVPLSPKGAPQVPPAKGRPGAGADEEAGVEPEGGIPFGTLQGYRVDPPRSSGGGGGVALALGALAAAGLGTAALLSGGDADQSPKRRSFTGGRLSPTDEVVLRRS